MLQWSCFQKKTPAKACTNNDQSAQQGTATGSRQILSFLGGPFDAPFDPENASFLPPKSIIYPKHKESGTTP